MPHLNPPRHILTLPAQGKHRRLNTAVPGLDNLRVLPPSAARQAHPARTERSNVHATCRCVFFIQPLRKGSVMTTLFDPIRFGNIAAANRIVMAPMARNRAGPGQVPTPLMAT